MLILLKSFLLNSLINFVECLKVGSYGVSIIWLIGGTCVDKAVCMKSVPPRSGRRVCCGKWLVIPQCGRAFTADRGVVSSAPLGLCSGRVHSHLEMACVEKRSEMLQPWLSI